MNLVVSQALASGLPVVATAHSGLREQVIDGVTGAIAPENNPSALAEKILALLDRPATWPALGRAGRAHIDAHYNAQKLIDRQLEDYRRLSRNNSVET